MLPKINDFVKAHLSDIMLFIMIVLLVMAAFGAGYLIIKYRSKNPIQIEYKK